MSVARRLKVVLCWHMHLPEYRDLSSGEYQLPWTYLHAIKDYVDMAAHLEQTPGARAVVNFAPVLLDQISDYAKQISGYMKDASALRDPLLAALDAPALPVRQEHRLALIKTCLRANKARMIEAFAPYRCLARMAAYPGGEERARWHIEKGLASFERHFGFRPKGCWPSEGGVSGATLALLDEYGFRWTASGGGVLDHSLKAAGVNPVIKREQTLYRPYQFEGRGDIACFFRDDNLSDLIGFKYATWHGDDAVANLVHHLENIANAVDGGEPYVVPIILDGENAWEYYPNNGYYFLSALYKKLAAHPRIELTTFSDYLDQYQRRAVLPHLVAGRKMYGTFSTWIGDKDKNRAWDMLGEVKRAYDHALATGYLVGEAREAAEQQLAACEGSDWCWWFGDYNPSQTVSDFERLYRLHLANLWHLIGEEPPEYLSHAMSHGGDGGAVQHSGTMRPGLKD